MNNSLLLGAHMSIAGGFEQSIARGVSIDCTTIQIFTKSNRQWHAKDILEDQIQKFRKAAHDAHFSPHNLIAHAPYLINIGSADESLAKKSTLALIQELERCDQLGIAYLVLHPGSRATSTQEECLHRIAQNLNHTFDSSKSSTMILLENMAGQGSVVCSRFEELAFIKEKIHEKKRLGFCFDTCHAFAAGYDFRDHATYTKMWKKFDDILGLNHLKVIHLNDSKKALDSHVDRHEDIGQGQLGLEPFRLLMNDERFFSIPKILETPRDTLEDYARNLAVLKSLIEKTTKKKLELQ